MRPCRGAEALGYGMQSPPARAMADYFLKDHKSPLNGFSPGVHLAWTLPRRPARSVRSGAVSTACLSRRRQEVRRSAIEIASGRLFAGRPPAWTLPRRPARSVLSGAVSTACLSQQQREVTPQTAWRSAIEIASGRLFAGRPPAWTPPRRPPRRSPGARRPLRRGFNRMLSSYEWRVEPATADGGPLCRSLCE
jgi:hypothetical protein